MKTFCLTVVLALLAFAAPAQPAWPCNPNTNKVEFSGRLPWPSGAATEAQRQALVRRWYAGRLSDAAPNALDADTSPASPAHTYAGVPAVAQLVQGSEFDGFSLLYEVHLVPEAAGLAYTLYGFAFGGWGESAGTPLEPHLIMPTVEDQAALTKFYKRLSAALTGLR